MLARPKVLKDIIMDSFDEGVLEKHRTVIKIGKNKITRTKFGSSPVIDSDVK